MGRMKDEQLEFAEDVAELAANYTPAAKRGIPTAPPAHPQPGDLYFNIPSSTMYIRMDDEWVAISGS